MAAPFANPLRSGTDTKLAGHNAARFGHFFAARHLLTFDTYETNVDAIRGMIACHAQPDRRQGISMVSPDL